VLVGGDKLRQTVMTNPNVDAFYLGYDYAQDDAGNCVCYLIRERVVKLYHDHPTKGWEWIGKVHEVMDFRAGDLTQMFVDGPCGYAPQAAEQARSRPK
jgi:hypothetical protein